MATTSPKTAKAPKPKPVPTLTVQLALVAGVLDEEGTRANVDAALAKYKSDTSTSREVIEGSLTKVFDTYRGQSINLPILASMAMAHIQAPPSSFPAVEERVKQFVRDNSCTLKTWTSESGKLFTLGKGVRGGVRRASDLPAPAVVAAEVAADDSAEESSEEAS